jgi:hypothetical protein
MPQQLLSLEPGKKQRLKLEWGGYYREFKVILDGREIGRIEGGQKALKEGHEFTLPDGSTLAVKLNQTTLIDELQVLRDGKPLPGSAADPLNKVRAAITTISLWGMIDLALGALGLLLAGTFITSLGFGAHSLAFGVGLVAAAYFVGGGALWAMVAALLLYVADSVTGFWLSSQAGIRPNSAAILARILFLAPIVRGLGALRTLRTFTKPEDEP